MPRQSAIMSLLFASSQTVAISRSVKPIWAAASEALTSILFLLACTHDVLNLFSNLIRAKTRLSSGFIAVALAAILETDFGPQHHKQKTQKKNRFLCQHLL